MGGFGSGRPPSGRRTVDEVRSIDVNQLARAGCLRAGWTGRWQWACDSEQAASIGLRAAHDRLHLSYAVNVGNGQWEEVLAGVRIVRATCRFGGTRAYFICPGLMARACCGRRAVKLYAAGRYFLCRHCYGLAYPSQSEGVLDRALRRANKIKVRLGGEAGMTAPFPAKPMRMWSRTYERLCDQALAAEAIVDEIFLLRAERLLAREHLAISLSQ